ncbi:MAG: putative PurR-regulated permease PerM, partial [Reinekea sp.]
MNSRLHNPSVQSSVVFFTIILVFLLFGLLLAPVLLSVLMSFVLYALLGPLNNRLVRTGLGRNKSAGILLLAAMVLVGMPLLYLFPFVSEALAGSARTVD